MRQFITARFDNVAFRYVATSVLEIFHLLHQLRNFWVNVKNMCHKWEKWTVLFIICWVACSQCSTFFDSRRILDMEVNKLQSTTKVKEDRGNLQQALLYILNDFFGCKEQTNSCDNHIPTLIWQGENFLMKLEKNAKCRKYLQS